MGRYLLHRRLQWYCFSPVDSPLDSEPGGPRFDSSSPASRSQIHVFPMFFHIFCDVLRACLVEVWHVFGRRLGHIFHIFPESVKTTRDRFSDQICLNMKPPGRSKCQNNVKMYVFVDFIFSWFFPVLGAWCGLNNTVNSREHP